MGKGRSQGQHISHDGACRGEVTGAGAKVHRLAHCVSHDVDGVENAIDACELVAHGQHRGMHAHVNARGSAARHSQELHAVAPLPGAGDVDGRDAADALDKRHVVHRDARVEADGCQNGNLCGSVETVDVGGGIRLGIAQTLGVRQDLVKRQALAFDAREHVVRRAVHDTGDGKNLVAGKRMLKRLDDGDATGHCSLAAQLNARLVGHAGKLAHAMRKHRLVGADHMLACRKRSLENLTGGMVAADELHHDVNLGVGHSLAPVRRKDALRKSQLLGMARAASAGPLQAQVDPIRGKIVVMMALEQPHETAADSAESDNRNVHHAHVNASLVSSKKEKGPTTPVGPGLLGR